MLLFDLKNTNITRTSQWRYYITVLDEVNYSVWLFSHRNTPALITVTLSFCHDWVNTKKNKLKKKLIQNFLLYEKKNFLIKKKKNFRARELISRVLAILFRFVLCYSQFFLDFLSLNSNLSMKIVFIRVLRATEVHMFQKMGIFARFLKFKMVDSIWRREKLEIFLICLKFATLGLFASLITKLWSVGQNFNFNFNFN